MRVFRGTKFSGFLALLQNLLAMSLCCLMTPGPSMGIRCHAWPFSTVRQPPQKKYCVGLVTFRLNKSGIVLCKMTPGLTKDIQCHV